MKKNMLCIVLALSLALMLAACGHTHAPGDWNRDAKTHWKLCECGEQVDAGEHTLDDMLVCTACGAEVHEWDDCTDVYLYNDGGYLLSYVSYDPDGTVVYEERVEYSFDAAGNILEEKHYNGDKLTEESRYTDGTLDSITTYDDEGGCFINNYDENGNQVSLISYDAAGNLIGEQYSGYVWSEENEEWIEVRTLTVEADGSSYEGEYNAFGDQIAWRSYDPDGNLLNDERYVYTYTDDGRTDVKETYQFDVLVEQVQYKLVTFEDGWMNYPAIITSYHSEGGWTVTEYDENDELVSQIRYDADGNVIE